MTNDKVTGGTVFNIQRYSIHDGPGIRTTVFLKGCPLSCIWCSTPESQGEAPEIAFYPNKCILCNDCLPVCPKNAIATGDKAVVIDRELCDNCGQCTSVCYTEALKLFGQEYTAGELVSEVIRDDVVYRHSGGGVTLSGGEPFFRPEYLLTLLKELKQSGISCGIDTCGFTARKHIEAVLPCVILPRHCLFWRR